MLTRRSAFKAAAGMAAASAFGAEAMAQGADKVIKIGLNLSFTGADALGAQRIANGAQMAFDSANARKIVKGHVFRIEKFDDATATAGQYDPAQGAINARKMVSDRAILAAIGPMMSGVGKAMSPILSAGNLPIITPSATNPDITDPKFASQFRPNGKAVFFRTVTTDAYQGPNMANFMADVLKVKTIYILDDSGAFGVGVADAFEGQARKKGMQILGRDRLDPKAADYAAVLTKIKSLGAQAVYYGGVTLAGVKVAKQSYDIIPNVIKAGADGIWGTDFLTAGGFPAVEGWYATQASPELVSDPKLAGWNKLYEERFKSQPDNYTITAHAGAEAIIDAVRSLVDGGKAVTRDSVRDALQNVRVNTIMGTVEFDANGDIKSKVVSVYQIKRDGAKKLDDPSAQYKYVGVAPEA
jgi:branched-chain amino acid transport system substrate-binding protein